LEKGPVLIVIPARYESKRFPGKMLADVRGKSLIYRVVERVRTVPFPARIVVATDHEQILDHLKELEVEVVMTRKEHQSGTDRCAEVASMFPGYQYVLNVQGDEPLIDPGALGELVERMVTSGAPIGTLCTLITKLEELQDPGKVKLVMARDGHVLYFSRAAIPHQRDIPVMEDWLGSYPYRRHIGVYMFDREALMRITEMPVSPLESSEQLEQLRWLENGYPIMAVPVAVQHHGVDTPEDLDRLLAILDQEVR